MAFLIDSYPASSLVSRLPTMLFLGGGDGGAFRSSALPHGLGKPTTLHSILLGSFMWARPGTPV